MPTRNVNLTEHFDRFIERQIDSGQYKNASEVMRAGLRLLERQAKEDRERLARLREHAREAFGAVDRGEAVAVEGDQELADFLKGIGQRVSRRRSADA
jgi:antitoxin ParD1/3/4